MIHMPRKAEHLCFQGKKDFEKQSMDYGVISFFVQLLRFCPCGALYEKNMEKGEISKNANIDDAIVLITPLVLNRFSIIFPLKAVMLSFQRKKEFLKLVQKQGSYDQKTAPHGQNPSNFTKIKITE